MHFQQQPTLKRFGGNPHTFAIQSQSALTSTKQDLCISRSAVRLPSLLRQAEPSCLHVGHPPVAKTSSDHLTTTWISDQVFSHTFFLLNAVTGIRRFLYSPISPGKFMLKVSTVSLLSQLHGVPSAQRPIPKSLHCASCSQSSRCCFVNGSILSVASSFSIVLSRAIV